jgi:hypothetical protein
MQITINTSDILGDETTIREEVIEQVVNALTTSMRKQAKETLEELLEKSLAEVVRQAVTEATAIAMDTKFTDVDSYGRVGKEASLRERIADYVQKQCTFKPTTYSSDATPFTNVVKDVVEKEVRQFKSDFNSLVSKQLIEQSMDMAVKTLKASIGIK